ncbi:xanthine phosphoribosyltransferase, partial [Megasphaera vaginalis (ex Srinivasan et al. 2021)]
MKELEEKILQDGTIIDNRILKVDNFLNQQIDVSLMLRMGQELAAKFRDCKIDKIVTIESSGIAVAMAVSIALGNVPVVFARKKASLLMNDGMYMTEIYSYTKEETYMASISKRFIAKGEDILLIDDFLASGTAALGLSHLVEAGGAHIAGIGIVIEKSFQPGRHLLEAAGFHVESLARIQCFENNRPVFARDGN